MTLVLFFLLLGLLFLAMEILAPGVVLGVVGGAALATGCGLAFATLSSGQALLVVLGTIVAVVIFFYLYFVVLPKSRVAKKFFIPGGDRTRTSQPALAEKNEVVGKLCVSVTALAPSGYVELDGKRFEAFSQSGFTPKGQSLRIVSLDNFRLIVTTV